MRKKACEKLGETKTRQEPEDGPGPCRKRKSTEFLEYLKYKQDSNKENTRETTENPWARNCVGKTKIGCTTKHAESNGRANENAAGIAKGNAQFISNIYE